jgi:acyl transferase domain-containing protein
MKQEDIAIIGMGFRFPGGLGNAAARFVGTTSRERS